MPRRVEETGEEVEYEPPKEARIGAGVGERWRVEEASCQAWRRMRDS